MLAVVSAAALALAGLSGCESTSRPAGPDTNFDARAQAFQFNDADWSRAGYRLEWRGFPTMERGERITKLQPYADLVIAQSSGSTVSALETATGRRRWHNQLAGRLTRFVGIARAGSSVYVVSESDVYTLNKDVGGLEDRQTLAAVANTPPVLVGNTLVFGGPTGVVFAHDLTKRIRSWGFAMDSAINVAPAAIGASSSSIGPASPTTDEASVAALAAISQRGEVALLDASSGSLRGKAQLFGGAAHPPVAAGPVVVVASLDQSIYAFSPAGSQMWRIRTNSPLRGAPESIGSTVYLTAENDTFTAINALTGQPLWTSKGISGRLIAARGSNLLVFGNGTLTVLERATGVVLHSFQTPSITQIVADKAEDGNLYAVSASGVVGKLMPR
jgi:outer membrane protein assembly factor BamB